MIEIYFSSKFLREFKKLPKNIQNEAHKKIAVFEKGVESNELKIHKLHSSKRTLWSFSVTYNYRVIFEKRSAKAVNFVTIGDHDVYKKI